MNKLLAASPQQNRVVIDVGKLVGAADGANPHLWYDPPTMPKVAQAVADSLTWIVTGRNACLNAVQLQLLKSLADERLDSHGHESSASL